MGAKASRRDRKITFPLACFPLTSPSSTPPRFATTVYSVPEMAGEPAHLEAAEEGNEPETVATRPNYWAEDGIFASLPTTFRTDIDVKTEYLKEFWAAQTDEVRQISFPRVQLLPPKRIRRIIKCDEDVMVRPLETALTLPYACFTHSMCAHIPTFKDAKQRVGKEVVELFGKAAELFVSELAVASWMNVLPSKKVIQIGDISSAVDTFHTYDFLQGIVPPSVPKPKRVVRTRPAIYTRPHIYRMSWQPMCLTKMTFNREKSNRQLRELRSPSLTRTCLLRIHYLTQKLKRCLKNRVLLQTTP